MPRSPPAAHRQPRSTATPVKLVRNYDYSPDLFEWVVYSSEFTGRKVIGTSDCLWGLLDGMNDDGLVISLTHGGRREPGPGIAIPLVVRYLLEVASTVEEARAALDRLPVAASYNLTMMDAAGAVVTAFVSPGSQPEYADSAVATNHRGQVPERPEHARSLRSVERQDHLLELLDKPTDSTALADAFLPTPALQPGICTGFRDPVHGGVPAARAEVLTYSWPGVSFARSIRLTRRQHHGVAARGLSAPHRQTPAGGDMAILGDDLDQLSSNDLGVLARNAMSILALRGDQEAFSSSSP